MGQNSDIHNIFESYSNKVLVKEQKVVLNNADAQALRVQTQGLPPGPEKDKADELLAAAINPAAAPAAPASAQAVTPEAAPISLADPIGNRMSLSGDSNQTSTAAAPQNALDAAPKLDTVQAAKDAMKDTPAPKQTSTTDYDKIAKQYGLNADLNNNFGGNVNLQGANPYDTNKADFSSINTNGGTNPIDKNPLKLNPDANIQPSQSTQPQKAKSGKTSGGGGSIVDYLAGKNQAFDKASRAKLAADNGIQNYTGTAEQNTELLNKLKANEKMPQGTNATGTVPKAPSNAPQQSQQPQQQQGMGGIIGGASKLAGGAGNLAKKALIGDQPHGGIVGGVSKLAGGAGNLFKKALIGGGQQQPAAQQAPVQQQAAPAPTNQAAPVKKSPTKQQTPPVKTTGLAADKYIEDEEIQENRNIAKFVKCLSEKNYSQAHEYLKKIVNFKVEKNLSKVINKI
jgi:hypothetical protein